LNQQHHNTTPQKKENRTMNTTQALSEAIQTAETSSLPTPEQLAMWRAALADIPRKVRGKGKATDYPAMLAKVKGFATVPDLYADGASLTRYTSDLNAIISTPSSLPAGAYSMVGKELIRTGDTPDAERTPTAPEMKGDLATLEMPAASLRAALLAVVEAQSQDETRHVLNGVLLQADHTLLTAVATDGRRLHIQTTPATATKETSFIIPSSAVAWLTKLLPDDETPFTITQAGQIMRVQCGEVWKAHCKLVDGHYPNYSGVIPTYTNQPTRINPQQWLEACKTLAPLENARVKDSKSISPKLYLETVEGTLRMSSRKLCKEDTIPEREIDLGIFPAMPKFAINPHFLTDALDQCRGETWLGFEEYAPFTIKSADFQALIMPIRAT
jgi:DNA polymerase III sliding clamp (beta) subunit (PCNA family)